MTDERLTELLERAADRRDAGSPPITEMLVRSRRVRRRRARLMALAASVIVGGAVVATSLVMSSDNQRSSQSIAADPSSSTTLEGTWNVISVLDPDGKLSPNTNRRLITFDNGNLSGNGGCGELSGDYQQSGNQGATLQIDGGYSVEYGTASCFDPLLSRLGEVRHVSGTGNARSLSDESGRVVVELRRAVVIPDLGSTPDLPPPAPTTCSPLAAAFDQSKPFQLSYDPETGRLVFETDNPFAINVNDRACWEQYPNVAKVVENVLRNETTQSTEVGRRETPDNAPCKRLQFAGQTYVPASPQNGIGVGGMLTPEGERLEGAGGTAEARGLDCGEKPELRLKVYSVMELPIRDAVSVSGTFSGVHGVWEYRNIRQIE